jgi:hypothetical protein
MKVRELIERLSACDPEAVVIPMAVSKRFSHPAAPATNVRECRARSLHAKFSVGPTNTKYLEMPESGDTAIVVIE